MTVLTHKREMILDRLLELAGDPLLVQQALVELNAEHGEAPTLEMVAFRILELRDEQERARAA